MNPPTASSPSVLRQRYRRIREAVTALVRVLAAAAVVAGVVVLAAWALDLGTLRSVLPGAVQMKANAALGLVLAGTAMLLLTVPRCARHQAIAWRLGQGLGALVALLALATGAQYLFGWNLGIDQLLVRDLADAYNVAKGRMSPYTAAALAGLGMALVVLPRPRWHPLAIAGASLAALVGLLSALGYAWGATEVVTDQWAPPVALNTSACLLSLGTATLLARFRFEPRRRRARLLTDPIEVRVLGSFAAALLALAMVGGMAYGTAAEYLAQARRVAEVKALRDALSDFYADMGTAAFAQRSYLLTGAEADIDRWVLLQSRMQRSQEAVRSAAAIAAVTGRADYLAFEASAADLLATLRTGVRIRRDEGDAAARAVVMKGQSMRAMASLRGTLDLLQANEAAEVARDEAILLGKRRHTLLFIALTLLVAAGLLGAMLVAIRREIARRAAVERSLRRRTSEATGATRFLESVVQNIPAMIFIKEAADLRFVQVNEGFERITGLQREAVLGKTDRDCFPPRQADHFIADDRRVLQQRRAIEVPEEEIQTAHDGVRLLHTRKIPLVDDHGTPTHLLGIAEDVTAAREQERAIRSLNEALAARADEVERINRAKSVFLATMSHEIRTPMHGMLGMLELLGLTPLESQQRRMVDVVRGSGKTLLRIIDDILDFSKIEADRLELREEVASLAAIVQDVTNIHSPVASSKGVVVSAQVDPALSPACWVDPVRLRQVLNNFVSNAVKFTPAGGVVVRVEVLSTNDGEQTVRLAVTDTGIGIAPEDQERLFAPFVQVGSAGQRVAGGTGLGLVISRRLVELMGGRLELLSEAGQGTTLRFAVRLRTASPELLPPAPAQELGQLQQLTAQLPPAPAAHEAARAGTLVLVVDDHPVNRALMEQQLQTLGYAAQAAADGSEALLAWESGRFGLVVTDCQMPAMDGYELARRIRAREAALGRPRTAILACTAMALEGEVRKCLDAGMDACLIKPVGLLQLREALQRWLPEPARTTPPPAVDRELVQATWGADPATTRSILDAYAQSLAEDAAALRDAAARQDWPELLQVTHRMLGASRMVGADGVAQACVALNAVAREAGAQALPAAMEGFDAACARVSAELGGPVQPAS